MHKLIKLAFVCALFGVGFALPAHALTPVSLCMPVYNSATGAESCVQGSLPKLLNGLTNTVTAVKGAAGLLGLAYCYNPNASVAYLQVFDAATAAGVTLGTTVPKLSLGIPSALASGVGPTALGVQFLNGIQVAITTTATGSTAPASAVDCNVTFN
jgi:hypothetical protein